MLRVQNIYVACAKHLCPDKIEENHTTEREKEFTTAENIEVTSNMLAAAENAVPDLQGSLHWQTVYGLCR
jgi:hypothetical protein